MKTILILNGPNLNLLGTREPAVYGASTLADVEAMCLEAGARLGFAIDCRQSNHEGVLLDAIHEAGRAYAAGTHAGVILNAGAYTHTSVALHDAIKGAAVLRRALQYRAPFSGKPVPQSAKSLTVMAGPSARIITTVSRDRLRPTSLHAPHGD